MSRFVFALTVPLLIAPVSFACWFAIDPGGFAHECPIIVRGPIVAVAEAGPGQERADDFASIKVVEIVRNELKDVPLKVGDILTVHMISRNNRLRTSTDINYPLKTDALWLVVLNAKGELRIDRHPVQKQPVDAKDKLRLPLVAREVKVNGEVEDRRLTKAQWIAKVRDDAERAVKQRAKQEASEQATRSLAKELAKTAKLEGEAMRRFQESPREVRRDVFQLRGPEQPLTGDRLVDVVEYTLRHEPDDNVRTHAVTSLGYIESAGPRAGAVLATALKDPSGDVRLFACQALHQRGDKKQAAAVAKLLKDEKANVRAMAVHALGRLGDTTMVPAILELYRREGKDTSRSYEYAAALARLGEKEASLRAAREALQRDAWHDRYIAIQALTFIDAKEVVPVLMEHLVPELRRTVATLRPGDEDRTYAVLCRDLAKRTGKTFGPDPLAWLDWWQTACKDYQALPVTVDRATARTAFAAYEKLMAGSKK